jgi:hypothetical protein
MAKLDRRDVLYLHVGGHNPPREMRPVINRAGRLIITIPETVEASEADSSPFAGLMRWCRTTWGQAAPKDSTRRTGSPVASEASRSMVPMIAKS